MPVALNLAIVTIGALLSRYHAPVQASLGLCPLPGLMFQALLRRPLMGGAGPFSVKAALRAACPPEAAMRAAWIEPAASRLIVPRLLLRARCAPLIRRLLRHLASFH